MSQEVMTEHQRFAQQRASVRERLATHLYEHFSTLPEEWHDDAAIFRDEINALLKSLTK